MQSLKNQWGMTLPEITVALGLMGGISLVTMKLVQDQAGNEVMLRARADVDKTYSIVKTALSDPENCRNVFNQFSIPAVTGTPVAMTRIEIPKKDVNMHGLLSTGAEKFLLLQVGQYDNFRVAGISFRHQSDEGQRGTLDAVNNQSMVYKISNIAVTLDFRIKTPGTKGKEVTVLKSIPLRVSRRTDVWMGALADRIQDCEMTSDTEDANAKRKFCTSLGSAVNVDPITGGCTIKNTMQCPYGQVVLRMTSLGGVICAPFEQVVDPSQLFDVSTCTNTGRYTIIEVGGKLRIQCI